MFSKITLNRDFRKIYQNGSRLKCLYFNLFFHPNNLGKKRLAVIASKKMGSAVKRNRAKRLLKEACRKLEKNFVSGFDLIISAKSTMIGLKLPAVLITLKNCLEKSGLLKQP